MTRTNLVLDTELHQRPRIPACGPMFHSPSFNPFFVLRMSHYSHRLSLALQSLRKCDVWLNVAPRANR